MVAVAWPEGGCGAVARRAELEAEEARARVSLSENLSFFSRLARLELVSVSEEQRGGVGLYL